MDKNKSNSKDTNFFKILIFYFTKPVFLNVLINLGITPLNNCLLIYLSPLPIDHELPQDRGLVQCFDTALVAMPWT